MKKFLVTFALSLYFLFTFSSKAENIKDFQIEGISLYDSLLNYYSKTQIEKVPRPLFYKDKTYTTVGFNVNSDNYDRVKFGFKIGDESYQIVGLTGLKYFNNRVKDCYNYQDKIINEIKTLFNNSNVIGPDFKKFSYDKNGSSRQVYLKLSKGDFVGVQCKKFGKELKKKYSHYRDNLTVSIFSKDYNYWLVNKAFK